ncbi:uncharacterized protein LOC114364139 [Ostrinia furnacalis]|uniref:uncharacterized protein LOC114364139 n=1 Tax=Ostrinia furnacalis TaxID=93504 RepID=UPI00103D3E6A|nr:uncharacterized protein LOC114364139 [Ostrinia furnacalis]
MYIKNIPIFSNIILLVSLFYRIKGDFGVIKEQSQIASRPQLENNFNRTPSEPAITTAITEDDEKFDDNELKKLFVQNFKSYENLEKERNGNGTHGTVRNTRDVANNTSKVGIECLSCFANGTSSADTNCYKGVSSTVKCSDAEQCFVELHPQYLRRGCILPTRVNRTYYCKCPLCNDKPSYDVSYYNYNSINDWTFDNFLLQKPLAGLDLMCKVCDTSGTNQVYDKNCRQGRGADYMVCGHNQLCYINIDDEVDHVSRGCKSKPVYNTMYFFCNRSGCNNAEHLNPKLAFRALPTLMNEKKIKRARSSVGKIHLHRINYFIWICILFISKY